jgi:glutamyl-tRNA synthetase
MPRGRFAPSPSGDLHLGGARTALLAWLAARRDGGEFLVRIEDLDRPRTVAGAEARILEDLRWLGLDWDEAPVRQSDRLAAYDEALASLMARDLVYPCYCSRADVAQAASAPHRTRQAYPGTCRELTSQERRSRTKPPSLRFRAPTSPVTFEDAIHGPITASSDDFVVRRADGLHAYQLAVVIDDVAAGIQEVVRGDDLLESTPRQLLLYEALGVRPPRFAHVPLVLGPDGRRLAKRHGDVSVRRLREAGWPPERLIGWLAATLNLVELGQELTPPDLLSTFAFEPLPREPTRLATDQP